MVVLACFWLCIGIGAGPVEGRFVCLGRVAKDGELAGANCFWGFITKLEGSVTLSLAYATRNTYTIDGRLDIASALAEPLEWLWALHVGSHCELSHGPFWGGCRRESSDSVIQVMAGGAPLARLGRPLVSFLGKQRDLSCLLSSSTYINGSLEQGGSTMLKTHSVRGIAY